AADGLEGLRAVEACRPAVVLLDIHMPNLDGVGFARELRRRGINIPILVVTASHCPGRLVEQIGAAGYLAKPFDLTDLRDAVERIVSPSARN
ncbi:MAG: response regulator, partial [Chloroflexota bacterium]